MCMYLIDIEVLRSRIVYFFIHIPEIFKVLENKMKIHN